MVFYREGNMGQNSWRFEVQKLYEKHKGMIYSIAKRYMHFADAAIEIEDLMQEAIFPLYLALQKLRMEKDNISAADETTIIFFYVKKHFDELYKNKITVILILTDGKVIEMTQSKYSKVKKGLPAGTNYKIINPCTSLLINDDTGNVEYQKGY